MVARALLTLLAASSARAFTNSRHDNLAVYWGQNSYGAANSGDAANWQKRLSYYCQDSTVDAIPVAFVTKFISTGGLPEINLASTCNNVDNATFAGTALADCSALAADVKTCQAAGKIVTISLGGGGTNNAFTDDAQAKAFADTLWNLFLGGSSTTRPLGSAVLDGVDIDIESGAPNSQLVAFANQLRSHYTGASKTYYLTAAPQCVYPDANLGTVLNAASFDAVYVQFYNNQCGVNNYGIVSDWNFGLWDYWARNVSPNKNVMVYIGAPASSSAGGGYVDAATLSNILTTTRKEFPSFGGAMLWDASQAWANGNYQKTIKSALTAAGGTGFTYPACSAPTYSSGSVYTQGQEASYQGYIWQAKWWTQSTPVASASSDWVPVSACSGAATTSTATSAPATTATVTPGNSTVCAGVAAWSSSTAYTANQQVTYNSELWTAKWWTQGDTPGGSVGVWTDNGACATSAKARAKRTYPTPAFEERDEASYWRTGQGRRAGMGRLFEWS